jgi:hypothetical protein
LPVPESPIRRTFGPGRRAWFVPTWTGATGVCGGVDDIEVLQLFTYDLEFFCKRFDLNTLGEEKID